MDITIRALSSETLEDFLTFFDGPAFSDNADWSSCYCFFPYHDPTTGDWEARSAAENRRSMIDGVSAGHISGLLAYHDDVVVGWCNANRRNAYPTLRNLPGNGDEMGATPCFVVDPQHRNKGIAGKLLDAACRTATDNGLVSMGAAPHRNATSAQMNSRGTYRMFDAAGYRVIAELPDGTTIMEKTL
ncbi:MAG: GNAT family N-acetyltransferase [Pseudomonadota bacterium]